MMDFQMVAQMAKADEENRERKALAIKKLKETKPCGHCLFVVGCDCCLGYEEKQHPHPCSD